MIISKKFILFNILLLILPAVIFLGFKLQNLSIRLSDTNIYFYIASEIIKGKILYKDIFFTNLPLFPLISVFYFYLVRGNLLHFYFVGAIEVIISYGLIYYILRLQKKSFIISFFSALLYLFSHTILVTSNGETGVFTATIFILLAFLFISNYKKYLLGGIFLGLCLTTKAYFFPISIAFFISLILSRNFHALKWVVIGSICAITIILIPFILFAKEQMFTDLIYISSIKSSINFGVSKLSIIQSFITYDFLFAIILCFYVIYWKKDYFISLAVLFFTLFFLSYKSFYPLYLSIVIPFLCLYAFEFVHFIQLRFRIHHELIFPSIIGLYCIYTSLSYLTGFSQLGRIPKVKEMVNLIKEQEPSFLYGSADIVPALSYYTQVPLLEGIIDTTNAFFESGFLKKDLINDLAIKQRTIIISKGIYYPERLLVEKLDASTFNKSKILTACSEIGSYPVEGGGFVNRLNIFKCY